MAKLSNSPTWTSPARSTLRKLSTKKYQAAQNFWNSVYLTVPATIISTVLGALNGYILSKWRFKGSDLLFTLMMFGVFMPGQIALMHREFVEDRKWVEEGAFLRALNRMDTFTSGMSVEGTIEFAGHDVRKIKNLYALRKRIGVVFPLPVGLPLSVYDNVALSPRLSGTRNKADLDVIVDVLVEIGRAHV